MPSSLRWPESDAAAPGPGRPRADSASPFPRSWVIVSIADWRRSGSRLPSRDGTPPAPPDQQEAIEELTQAYVAPIGKRKDSTRAMAVANNKASQFQSLRFEGVERLEVEAPTTASRSESDEAMVSRHGRQPGRREEGS